MYHPPFFWKQRCSSIAVFWNRALHVPIYIEHCASGAVAELRSNVRREFNGTVEHGLVGLTAETEINVKVNVLGTNPNRG